MKGFVDDMIQDISDVIAFIHEHAVSFNGDKVCYVYGLSSRHASLCSDILLHKI